RDRVLGADDELRDDVAPQAVGAQPVRGRRPLQFRGHVDLGGRVRCPHQRQRGGEEQPADQHAADQKAGVPDGPIAEGLQCLVLKRGSMTTYSTSTTKLIRITAAASSITMLRTTIRSRLK